MSFQPLSPRVALEFSHGVAYFGEPMVEVEVAATDPDGILLGEPRLTTVLVDSGADYTILDARLAPVLGIDLALCVPADTSVVGGGTVPGRATHLKIGLCDRWVDALTVFQERPSPQLLGREGVFEHVAITFLHGQSRMLATLA